jgi:hypothetical protein
LLQGARVSPDFSYEDTAFPPLPAGSSAIVAHRGSDPI